VAFGLAALPALFAGTIAGQLPTYLWTRWTIAALPPGSWYPGPFYELSIVDSFRVAALAAASLAALAFLDRRGTRPLLLFFAAAGLAVATALLLVAAWFVRFPWDPDAGIVAAPLDQVVRSMLSIQLGLWLLAIAIGGFLATPRRARWSVGLAYAAPSILASFFQTWSAGIAGERIATALNGAGYVLVTSIAFPMAVRLVVRMLERIVPHGGDEPCS
jgi:hypothetical protein